MPAPTARSSYARPPSVAPTVMVTLFFGLFGLIPAAVQTSHAKMDGISTNRYWHAFWITVAAQSVVAIGFFVILAAALGR